MQDEAEKLIPLTGRVVLGKKEAATSAIFVVILINMVVLVLVRAAGALLPSDLVGLFWFIVIFLLALDIVISPTCFVYAMREVTENDAAPAYTIALKEDGMLVLFHRGGRSQTLNPMEIIEITSHIARFNWNSIAGDAGRGYGTVKMVVRSKMGRIVNYKVKYVVDCVDAAEYLRELFSVPDKEKK